MRRKIFVGMGLALVIIGGVVWILVSSGTRPRGERTDPEAVGPSAGGEEEVAASEEETTPVPGPAATEDGEKESAAVEEELEIPPLLRGRVVGEGVGIPNADVLFFSVGEVERLLERLERLIPQGGVMPDVPRLVAALRGELEHFRTVAVRVTTDADGWFELPDGESGGYLLLTVAKGWLFRYGDVVSLDPERTEELTIELERGAAVGGRVVDPGGAAVPGVTVVAEYRPPGMPGVGKIVRRLLRLVNGEFLRGPFETQTGADGSFEINSLPPGNYDLAAIATSGVEARLENVTSGTRDAVILLGKEGSVFGTFAGSDGFPIASVPVTLEPFDQAIQLPFPMNAFSDVANTVNQFLGDGPRHAVSRADGSFVFGALGAGRYRLSVKEKGFLPLQREIELEWGERHSLGLVALDRGEVVRGWVRSDDGVPLAGATVLGTPAEANMLNMGAVINDFLSGRVQVASKADGSFELAGLKHGQVRLTVTHQGYAAAVVPSVATGGEPVEVALAPGMTLTGKVVEAGSDRPIGGARVRAAEVRARADAEGVFVLEGVAPRDEAAMNPFGGGFGGRRRRGAEGGDPAESDARSEVTLRASAPGYHQERIPVDLDLPPQELTIELASVPELSGVVYDPDGNPAPGALVRLTPSIPDEFANLGFFDTSLIFLAVTVSNLEGRFRFRDFREAENDRYRVIADHMSWARGTTDTFQIVEPGTEDMEVEVHLVSGGSVTGTVSDGARPIPGAVVRLAKAQAEPGGQGAMFIKMLGLPPGGKEAHSNSQGEFRYTQVVPGDYTVTVEVAGFTDSREETFTLGPGEARQFEFVMDPGGEILGAVVDDVGEPIEGARVRILREDTGNDREREIQKFLGGAYKTQATDAEGAFAVSGLPAGTYTLIAEKRGFSPAEKTGVSPGARPHELVLVPAAAVRGFVEDAASGAPVTSFRLRLKRQGDDDERGFPFRRGQEFDDPEGRFVKENLESGTYDVEIRARGYAPLEAELVLEPGELSEPTFRLAAAGRIRGRVVDQETGAALPGASVALARRPPERSPAAGDDEKGGDAPRGPSAEDKDAEAMRTFFTQAALGESVSTDGSGGYLLESVPEGTQTVVVTHPDYVQAFRGGVEVALGEELALEFTLSPGLSVSGEVVDGRGQPLPGRFLFLRGNDEATRRVRKTTSSDERGRFRIAGLGPGAYRLVSPSRGGSRAAVDVSVAPDRDVDDLRLDVAAETE